MERVVFFNTAWMVDYQGLAGDPPYGGGRHVRENRWGSEIYNFKPHRGRLYGFVRHSAGRRLNLHRLGAGDDDQRVEGVTVVWTAPKPYVRGRYVVGWYRNATLFDTPQPRPARGFAKISGRRSTAYLTTCAVEDGRLLLKSQRTEMIPSQGRNVWYGDARTRRRVLAYMAKVDEGGDESPSPRPPRQSDVAKRLRVEQAAMEAAKTALASEGFHGFRDVSTRKSWDFEATQSGTTARIEVKGLSGEGTIVQLTPSEFDAMREDVPYVLAIVQNALLNPRVKLYYRRGPGWDPPGLVVEPKTGALIRLR